MSDLVIACINALGQDQPKLMMFTSHHGHLIRDIEIPGVDDNYMDEAKGPNDDLAPC